MVLTFPRRSGGGEARNDVRLMLIGALACNLAWGIHRRHLSLFMDCSMSEQFDKAFVIYATCAGKRSARGHDSLIQPARCLCRLFSGGSDARS